jgi:predicted transcriptional regulator
VADTGSLEEREWIRRRYDAGDYAITWFGQVVIEDLEGLLETVETTQRLEGLLESLPTESMDFDLRRFRTARITRPTRTDHLAPSKRCVELMEGCAARFFCLGTMADRFATQELPALVESIPEIEGVYTRGVFETVRGDPEMRAAVQRYLRAGGELSLHDDDFPVRLGIYDETVGLALNDGRGFVPALIESDDETILRWAEEIYSRFRDESRPLDESAFAPDTEEKQ